MPSACRRCCNESSQSESDIRSLLLPAPHRLGAALRAACQRLDVGGVSQLLLGGAEAGAPGSNGRTPMHELAAAACSPQAASVAGLLVNMLLQHGAQVGRLICVCLSL